MKTVDSEFRPGGMMFRVSQILVAVFAMMFMLSSCNKDDAPAKESFDKAAISAKWIVSGSSDYVSFEFNKSGNYIVEKKSAASGRMKSSGQTTFLKHLKGNAAGRVQDSEQTIFFGTYEILNDSTISLSDFGKIIITKISDDVFSFSLQLTGNPDKITISASKKEEMTSSSKTDLLCKTWEMVKYNGAPAAGTEMELTVLFSKAGTYFVSYANPAEGEDAGGLAQWKWRGTAETEFLYTWEQDVWEDDAYVTVTELTATTLKMTETLGDETDTYELKAVGN